MREPFVSGEQALRERLSAPAQTTDPGDGAGLPPHAISFLSQLRLLIGVPFEYLVPDPRLLPDECIRFFHLDRSWTDRLVDGALAVGKIGTREQAHHQSAAPAITSGLDKAEPDVRASQQNIDPPHPPAATPPITGFLLRSAAVAGWPHMEVRAYDAEETKLALLRLQLLAPAVMLALFAGVAVTIELEEPHHGIQFGATVELGSLVVDRRRADGTRSPASDTLGSSGPTEGFPNFTVGLRDATHRVVEIAGLRRLLNIEAIQRDPQMPMQTGSAGYAVQLLQPPFRQVFSDHQPPPDPPSSLATTAHAPVTPTP